MFWFNEVENSLGGFAHSLYIAERDNILAMRREDHSAKVVGVQSRRLQARQFDAHGNASVQGAGRQIVHPAEGSTVTAYGRQPGVDVGT